MLNGIKLYENTFLIRLQFSMLLGPIGSLKINHFDTLGPFTMFSVSCVFVNSISDHIKSFLCY